MFFLPYLSHGLELICSGMCTGTNNVDPDSTWSTSTMETEDANTLSCWAQIMPCPSDSILNKTICFHLFVCFWDCALSKEAQFYRRPVSPFWEWRSALYLHGYMNDTIALVWVGISNLSLEIKRVLLYTCIRENWDCSGTWAHGHINILTGKSGLRT